MLAKEKLKLDLFLKQLMHLMVFVYLLGLSFFGLELAQSSHWLVRLLEIDLKLLLHSLWNQEALEVVIKKLTDLWRL